MNPLDLPGPGFLAFYLLLGAVTCLLLLLGRKLVEVDDANPNIDVSDPYLIAYLRGGKLEAVRVAVISLVDRGLLHGLGDQVSSVKDEFHALARRPIERYLLSKLRFPHTVAQIAADRELEVVCRPMHEQLVLVGALPDQRVRSARLTVFFVGLFVLVGTAGAKIVVALSRGRQNIWFLIALTGLTCFVAYRVTHPRRTSAGNAVLSDLKQLFSGLRQRASSIAPGGASGEVALLASVFGIAAIPTDVFPRRKELFPGASGGNTGSSCGSGSSCGASCGGGGGCGGGCGGCGG